MIEKNAMEEVGNVEKLSEIKRQETIKRYIVILSGILTFGSMMLLYAAKGFVPFGTKSLAWMDANIQYLDFFSYFKDILSGKNDIGYTFGKTLGGNNVAVLSYYLTSPFCLLLPFFKNTDLEMYLNLITALKLSTASMTFAYFAVNRFERRFPEKKTLFVVMSLGYGLCQYNIAQSSNTMWLDGVYMLPLILLQVYKVVHGKPSRGLSCMVGLAILFNWYTAGIDCFFSGCWFVIELCLMETEKKEPAIDWIKTALRYVKGMLLGVALSGALFLPTIAALRKSTRGSLHPGYIRDFSFIGEIPSVFQLYTYGGKSAFGEVALFCGSLAVILCISLLLNDKIAALKKVILSVCFVCTILAFYWMPFYAVFSLFQWVSSYYYRYSYLGCFSLLSLGLYGALEIRTESQKKKVIKISAIYAGLLIIFFYLKKVNTCENVYATAVGFLLMAVLFYGYEIRTQPGKIGKRVIPVLLVAAVMVELQWNASLLMNEYSVDDNLEYQSYRQEKEKIVASLQSKDQTFYRMSDLQPRGFGESGLTANYNEAISYNYRSISGYTSSPDDIQREFLDRLGYSISGENLCVTNDSILGADSLLGVKYVISETPVDGLTVWDGENGTSKTVYENPYVFPMAFVYQNEESRQVDNNSNPFEYQNQLFQKLLNQDEDLYEPLNYKVLQKGNAATGETWKIKVDLPEGEYVFYGNLPWYKWVDASISIDGKFITDYACWLSPSVFSIPHNNGECIIEVKADSYEFDLSNVQFYAIDLKKLKHLSEKANRLAADVCEIENGSVYVDVKHAEDGENLFLSVPYDSGWKIIRNGEDVETELIGECLYSIPLVDGENEIVMVYHVPYLKAGIVLSLLSVAFLCAESIGEKEKRVKK